MIIIQWFITLMVIFFIFSKKGNIEFLTKIQNLNKKFYYLIAIILVMVLLFLRYYKLAIIPLGTNIDEAGILYDSMLLSKTGFDRYNISWPVYFNNYGRGMSAMYIYLNVILSMGRITLFKTRFIIASLSVIMALFAFLIIKRKYGIKYAVLGLFLITTLPYFVMASRWALDCNLFVIVSTFAIFFYLLAIENNKPYLYIFTGILFGSVLYTYALSYLVIPIFLLISLSFLLYRKKITVKSSLFLLIPIILMAIPLLSFVAVNSGLINEFSFFNKFSVTKLIQYRKSEFSINNVINNLNLIKIYLFGVGFNFNVIDKFSTLYIFSSPIIIYGIVLTARRLNQVKYDQDFILLFFLISCVLVTLIIYIPNVSKSNQIYFSLVYFLIVGLKNLFDKNNLSLVLIPIYLIFSFIFSFYYFTDYSKSTPDLFEHDLYEVINYNEINNPDKLTFVDVGYNYAANVPLLISLDLPSDYLYDNQIGNYDLIYSNEKNYDVYLIRSSNYIELEEKLINDGYNINYHSGFTIYSK